MERKKDVLKKSIVAADLGKNPLAERQFKIEVVKRVSADNFTLSDEGMKKAEFFIEKASSVKVYTHRDNRELINRLTPAAKSLFLWFVYKVEDGEDWLWLNKKAFMKEAKMGSINTFKKGLAELIFENIICPSKLQNVYWVNPSIIFSGSRIKKYPDKVIEYNPNKITDNGASTSKVV